MNSVITARARLILLALLGVCLSSTLIAAEDSPEWHEAERKAFVTLTQPEASLADAVRQIEQKAPISGQEAMFRASIFLRAGMNEQAIQSLRDLKRLSPDLAGSMVSSMYHSACDDRQVWDVAQAICEIFGERVTDITLENRLIKHMQETGWSDVQIDAWLAARPSGVRGFWLRERMRFNADGARAKLLAELAEGVRSTPTDADKAIEYLEVLTDLPQDPQAAPDLTWMSDVVRPRLATEAARLAELLNRLSAKAAAVVFYRKAIETSLTDEDLRELS
jgi:hypothetical protein